MLKKTHLYRHFDANGRLLYVGISLSALKRLSQHHSQSRWSDQIANVTIETFDTRDAALEAERQAIVSELPLHNKVHNLRSTTLPPVPQCFRLSSFEDDDPHGFVVLCGTILDAEEDTLVVSIGSDGSTTIHTPKISYIEVDGDFLERLSEMIDVALAWYEEVEGIGPTANQMRRAYGHLRGRPPTIGGRWLSKCGMDGCEMFAPEIQPL